MLCLVSLINKTDRVMKINKITIKNFRGFQDKTFELDSKMNVILGNNTAGKTTLLHAVQIALGAYMQSMKLLPKEKPYRKNFASTDRVLNYNMAKDDFMLSTNNPFIQVEATVLSKGKNKGTAFSEEKNISWFREAKGNTTIHSKKNVGELIDIVDYWVKCRESQEFDTDVVLPVVLAFGANRIDNQYKQIVDEKLRDSKIAKAYKYALAETVDFKSALNWIYKYNSSAKNTKEIEGTDKAFFAALETAARLQNIAIDKDNRGLWADVQVSGQPKHRLKYEMMSDGFKAMVNIVSEVAYRCIMLNGWLGENAVTETPGIVLIDEIDLYLHPHWQQHVLKDLQNAFPNIQFIVSTHSPFIAQSVRNRNVITLDGKKTSTDPVFRSIEEIAINEMNVNTPRSALYELMVEKAERYYQLVKEGESNAEAVEDIQKELNEIEIQFSDDPAYVALLKAERNSQ